MKASMQKLIAMGLCVVLAVGSLTGCGGSSNDAGSASGDGAKTSSSSDKKTFSDLGGMDITVGDWLKLSTKPFCANKYTIIKGIITNNVPVPIMADA